MPTTLYLWRRHVPGCPQLPLGRKSTQCDCPIYADGRHPVTGARVKRAMDTRNWSKAQNDLDRWISGELAAAADNKPLSTDAPSLNRAIDAYLADCKHRGLAASTIESYRYTLRTFHALLPNITNVAQITVPVIREWRNARAEMERRGEKTSVRTLRKEIEHLRSFCEFLLDSEWIHRNPARKVKSSKDTLLPTMPFSSEEVAALIRSCDTLDCTNHFQIDRTRARAKALVYLLLYSGLRIGDAIMLTRNRLQPNGRLLLRMEKTNNPVYVKLHPAAVQALQALPEEGPYFFWSGTSKPATVKGNAQRTIVRIGKAANVPAHAHRFRDTFAVELLSHGAELRTVQLLLGHTSIRTTEKHYAPYVLKFQKALDKATAKLRFG